MIKFFFFTLEFINLKESPVHFDIFPFINLPDDFPCPEYSKVIKLIFFFKQNFANAVGFSPSISDIKPCKKIIHIFEGDFMDKYLIFFVLEILKYLNRLYDIRVII